MPNAYVKSLARKTGKSISEVESLWDKAFAIAAKKLSGRSGDDIYAYTMGILQKMLKEAKRAGLLEDPDVLITEYLLEGEMEINKTKWKIRQDPKASSSKIFDRNAYLRRREERDAERRKKQKLTKERLEPKD